MSCTLSLTLQTKSAETLQKVTINHAIVAGWTGRDRTAVEKHISELEAIGVRRPSVIPTFYRVAAPSRLTTSDSIQVLGTESSGEVECVLLKSGGRLWFGVGSDHTDRKVEGYDVNTSKQLCEKPIAPVFWAFDDVEKRVDQLVLRSHLIENRERILYQEGMAAALLNPRDLIAQFAPDGQLPDGVAIFCGTFAAVGGIRAGTRFEFELEDSITGRHIKHGYDVTALPMTQ